MWQHLRLGDPLEVHVECNLDSVDIRDTPLVGNELEVDEVDNWPHLPGALARGQEIVLNLASNRAQRISVDKAEVCKENNHKHGAPHELVEGNLRADTNGIGPGDSCFEPAVEEVSTGAIKKINPNEQSVARLMQSMGPAEMKT